MITTIRGVAALAALVALAGSHWFTYSLGSDKIAARWAADRERQAQERTKQAQEHAKVLGEYRDKEQRLQRLLDDSVRANRNEVNRIARERDAAVRSLHDRPVARADPAPAPQAPEGARPAVGCTGAGLARPDAEFLVGFAADAARTTEALKTCLDSYKQVQRTINSSGR